MHTHFEDLSNEIFFEIFDYLHALDIFTGFYSLNQRISSILQSIPFRVVISNQHRRSQVEYLSSHLAFHAHQVISLDINDAVRDDISTISLLFDRHQFINLRSCVFHMIQPSTKLESVIKQLKNTNTLLSFTVNQDYEKNVPENDLLPILTMLMHKSSSLRSIYFRLPYDYLRMPKYSISSNITSLYLQILASPATISVYSVLPILHLFHSIRHLGILLINADLMYGPYQDVSRPTLPIDDDDLPILSQVISFDLTIFGTCDGDSLSYVLRCMPNLKYFYFQLKMQQVGVSFSGELVDGHAWRRMLQRFVPCLSKFEFHMAIAKGPPCLNLHLIVNSFICLVRKYSNWHMTIDRYRYGQYGEEFIILRTLNYHKCKSSYYIGKPYINGETFETLSTTTTTTTEDHSFYPDIKMLSIYVSETKPSITWLSPLYHNVNYLHIYIPRVSSIWNSLLTIAHLNETSDNDAQKIVTNLSHFVHLVKITRLRFIPTINISQWKYIQFILQACPNVIDITINAPLLLYWKLIDNPSLFSIFEKVEILESNRQKLYFHPNFASKFAQRFKSLKTIILSGIPFDDCLCIIDIFLTQMENLSYIRIAYQKGTISNDPFLRDYVTRKRREAFPDHALDESMVNVKNNGKEIRIWLS